MSKSFKNQGEILSKLGIAQLNPMQEEAGLAIEHASEVLLLSPTGTGKTLAFLLPILRTLDRALSGVQCMILVPTRELAIQIEQVVREMGAGFKCNAIYGGGQSFQKDKLDLQHPPALLIGTPGRVSAHVKRSTFSTEHIHTLVLDEFDKSLEVGFEEEMQEIIGALRNLEKRVLTSASTNGKVPDFVGLKDPIKVDYLGEGVAQLRIKSVLSTDKDKLARLGETICHLGAVPGIVFCNFRDSIERVSDFLSDRGIAHGCYHGGMEQQDRERTLIKFRNGTHQLIVATDLAARGLDIPEIRFIIHYHLPKRKQEFTHRNGRTARMNAAGTAYVLQWEQEELPDFIPALEVEEVREAAIPEKSDWQTVFVSGGRRDKISKGDIAGFFCKQGGLNNDHIGMIELKQDCAFVAVHKSKTKQLLKHVDNGRLKKKKVRVHLT